MTFINISAIARKEYQEHKRRFLFIFFAVPALSAIFLLPHLFIPTSLLENFVNQYNLTSSEYTPDLRRQILLVEFQLPLYIIVPAFAVPYFGILESIIGERDARTLEGLLALPLNRWEILFGKTGPSMIGSIFISWFSFCFHMIFFLVFVGKELALHFLNIEWFIVLIFLVPAIVYSASMTAILIAFMVKKIQTAVNLATLIFTPLIFLLIGISIGEYSIEAISLVYMGILFFFLGIIMTCFVWHQFSIERLILSLFE